jgi:hypothetical protein
MVWADILMNFLEGFPHINGKSVIIMVVDRFSKLVHFVPIGYPYTVTSIAQAFFITVVGLHGIPNSIVSDRHTVLTSCLWSEVFALVAVKLNLSSAFHPQSDGQLEAANRIIAMYLCCLTSDRPRQMLKWLP